MILQILILHLGIQLIASQTCDEASGWHEFNGNCLRVSRSAPETQLTWKEARATCLNDGGELASVHSQEEQDFIIQLATDIGLGEADIWIGMNQLDDRDGSLGWSDGTEVVYTNWANSQPMMGGLTYCTYSATEAGPGPFEIYPYASTVYGILNPDYDYPTDADGVYTFYFGQNFAGTYSWCEDLCEANSRCAGATFYYTHYNIYWDHVCVGRSDDISILGPDNDAHSGVRSLSGGDDYGLWYSANCGLSKALACKKAIGSDTPLTLPPTPIVDSYCPPNYIDGGGNKCYRVVTIPTETQGMRWEQALLLCRSGPGYYPDLASIHSLEDNSILTAQIQNFGWNYWIGLHYASQHDAWVWADNTEPVYSNWADGHPIGPDYCVEMRSVSGPAGQWASQSCDQQRGYICQTYKDANNIISTPAFTTPHKCEAGWTPYWYGCYQYQSTARTWADAKTYCESQDSILVTIHAAAENAAVIVGVDGNFPVWIGLQKNQTSGGYNWLDGWGNYYLNFDDGGQDSGEGCVAMKSNGKWNDTVCSDSHVSVCKKTDHTGPSVPPPGDGYCNSNWVKWGFRCYFFSPSTASFSDALVNCQLLDGDLVSVENAMENDFIKNYMNTQPYMYRAWIGLFRNPAETEYKWTDGSDSDFRNWAPGQPSNPLDELCVEMENDQISNYPGYWYDNYCDNYNYYICEAPQGPAPSYPPVPTSGPGDCPSYEWDKYGTDCLLIRPMQHYTWHSALEMCKYLTGGIGSLASINDQTENLLIESRAKSLVPPGTWPEPSLWIGLSKAARGYPYLWEDGNDNIFRMWAPGEPNDIDGTQNCVRMYLYVYPTEGMWDDYYCSDYTGHGFVCRTPQGYNYAAHNIDEANFKVVLEAKEKEKQRTDQVVKVLNEDVHEKERRKEENISVHWKVDETNASDHPDDNNKAIIGSILGVVALCVFLVATMSVIYWRKRLRINTPEQQSFENPLAGQPSAAEHEDQANTDV